MTRAFFIFALAFAGSSARAGEDPRPAAGIQDNSFLIEEAYNQEPGVIQHINTWRRLDQDWYYTFTEELPLGSQLHQFSVTAPYSWLNHAAGFGDLQLNYRYQLSFATAQRPAIAPRTTIILPTGNEREDLGAGSTGFQFNLPVSKIVSDRLTLHFNAGATTYIDIHDRSPTSYALGGSVIYAVTRDFNLMLESIEEWNETVTDDGHSDRNNGFTISPGARCAINLKDTQIVLGAASPIQFESNDVDYGVFLYLSVEHGLASLEHRGH